MFYNANLSLGYRIIRHYKGTFGLIIQQRITSSNDWRRGGSVAFIRVRTAIVQSPKFESLLSQRLVFHKLIKYSDSADTCFVLIAHA